MLVAIDAGHGSNTAGKRTPDGYKEHWINVRTASYFNKAMKRCGINTIKVGWNDDNSKDDADISLVNRQKAVKNSGAILSISFHANAHGSGTEWTTAEGIETLIHSDKLKANDSLRLANLVQAELINGTPQKNRGVKTMELAMCNCVAMGTKASILIEIGFMTNKHEADLMKSEAFCKECAEEAAKGVCNYLNVKYEEEEMVDKVKVLYKGLEIEVERVFINGTNYIRMRDLEEKLGICKVSYDEKKNMPVINNI